MKCYEDGRMSQHLKRRQLGDALEMRGPIRGLIVRKGVWKHIGLIGGGSGITPLWQVLHDFLRDPESKTELTLIYQNRFEEDILLKEELDLLAETYSSNFKTIYILSKPPENWKGLSGRLDAEILRKYLPGPDKPDVYVMICGPPGLNNSVAGEFDPETFQRAGGLLQQLGYKTEQFHVF